MVEAAGDDEKELAAQMAAEFLNEDLSEQQFGAPKAGPGMWASILRMLDPIKVPYKLTVVTICTLANRKGQSKSRTGLF